MKLLFSLAVLVFSTAFSFAQAPTPTSTPELSEKEFEDQLKKAFEERDRILSKPQVIYYAPVISPSAEEIAYFKRTLEYRLKGGGFMPFLDSAEFTWLSDKVEVVRRNLFTGSEYVVLERTLPAPRNGVELSGVWVYLEWDKKLVYSINLSGYEKNEIPEGIYCRGNGVCLGSLSLEKQGSNRAKGITVGLDIDFERHRYPISNKIAITCEEKVVPCPKF